MPPLAICKLAKRLWMAWPHAGIIGIDQSCVSKGKTWPWVCVGHPRPGSTLDPTRTGECQILPAGGHAVSMRCQLRPGTLTAGACIVECTRWPQHGACLLAPQRQKECPMLGLVLVAAFIGLMLNHHRYNARRRVLACTCMCRHTYMHAQECSPLPLGSNKGHDEGGQRIGSKSRPGVASGASGSVSAWSEEATRPAFPGPSPRLTAFQAAVAFGSRIVHF